MEVAVKFSWQIQWKLYTYNDNKEIQLNPSSHERKNVVLNALFDVTECELELSSIKNDAKTHVTE